MEFKLENPINIIHAYENQGGWHIDDISLSSAGKIAFSGRNHGTKQSFVCIYSSDDNPDSRDQPALVYHKQFADKLSWPRRISFIIPNCTKIITCQNDEVHVIEHNRDVVLRSCRVIGRTTCLSVSENQILIGIFSSDIVNIYDNDLNEIKSIRLQGIKGDWPGDITAAAEKLYVRTGGYPGKAIAYSQKSGSILTEFTTGEDSSHACSTAVNIHLELTAVLWYLRGQPKIIFYHLSENISFLTVNAEPGIVRIRISDRGRIATADEFPGGLMVYDLGSVLSYSHLKENLASRLERDVLEKLTHFFAMEGEELNTILNSDRPAASFLFALEEKSVIHASNVDKLEEAFRGLKLSRSFCHAVNLYQKIKDQITAYDRFLASLSAHLTSSVPAQLCGNFHIPNERKNTITSSQNPGLSLLLILDEMGAIKSSEVGSLEEPLSELRLVQAVAKIHEYKEILHEENRRLPQTATNNLEVKKTIFVEFLKKKIKSWYETMTPVPWKKSCQWKATDLFVGSGLILIDSKSKQNIQNIDEKCKLNYTDIFTHEKLKSEIRIKLEGDPGSGKTMLLSQLAYDWSKGKIDSVDIVIFLPLKIVGDKTLIQAVKEFYIPTDMAIPDKDIEAILESSEEKICLLLDGLEEYSTGKGRDETKESTEVMKIIKKEKHSNCKVVISTRSDFAHDLPEFPSLKVGRFGELQRELYIKQLYADNTNQQEKVQSIIQDNPFILDLCSVPLLFVLAVHNIDNVRLSKDTQLNKVSHFMSNMILQLCPTAPEVEGVPLEICRKGNEMMTLGELAFNGLCKGHQQLSWQKDFMERNVYNYKLWVDSGILILEEGLVMPERKVPEVSETITGHNQVSQSSALSDFSTTAPAHSTEASIKERELGGPKSGITRRSVRRTPDQVPLVVKFLHKVIQEWFAAKFFSSKMKSCTGKEEFHNYVTSQLQHIHPADLHYVLRFTSSLHPPSCHVMMNYLRRSYRKGGSVPPYIMDCMFLCFIEHNDDKGPDMRNAVEEVCREVITIQSEDSGLLQQAKSAFVQYACNNGVVIETLQLNDVILSVDRTNLTLNYGIQFGLLHTVKMIKVSRWDQRVQGEDYRKILEFLSACKVLKEVCCIFPINPPDISDKVTLHNILSKNMKVEWHVGHCVHSLDPGNGQWELNFKQPGNKCLTEPRDVSVDKEPQLLLETKAVITNKGGVLEIPDTGVVLKIPPNALPDDKKHCDIHMRIISDDRLTEEAICFSSNSSIVVELLPDNLRFQYPVRLSVPHCLVLQRTNDRKAQIFVSHHKTGNIPKWEEQCDLSYHLEDTACVVFLDRFCWVKIRINDDIVEARKIVVYTAAKKFMLQDEVIEIQVGYYPDLPGAREKIRKNASLVILHRKPFYFVKTEQKYPLRLSIKPIVLHGWKLRPPSSLTQEIPYVRVASPSLYSCPCIFNKPEDMSGYPVCVLTASQEKGQIAVQLTACVEIPDKNFWSETGEEEESSVKVKRIIDQSGRVFMEIPDTGVKLEIPPGALEDSFDPQTIDMSIIPTRQLADQMSFCAGSTTAVELSPSDLKLKLPATLILPHCLTFKEGCKLTARISFNLEKGIQSPWTEQDTASYILDEVACTIKLNKLCCVKYSVDDELVTAKIINVYAAAKNIYEKDEFAELEVGYYPKIQGRGEILTMNPNFTEGSPAEHIFMDEKELSLQVLLKDITPTRWTKCFPQGDVQELPFRTIASSIEHSHLYVLKKEVNHVSCTTCIFMAIQGERESMRTFISLTLRQQTDHSNASKQSSREGPSSQSMKDVFQYLSANLGDDWLDVGRNLGLEDGKLNHIKADNLGSRQEAIYKMLLSWKQTANPTTAQRDLIKALHQSKRKDLAKKV